MNEQFGLRLGFIWYLQDVRQTAGTSGVPYMAGKYGGAAFILVSPPVFLSSDHRTSHRCIIDHEFSAGRASQKSIATILQCTPGTAAHQVALHRWAAIAGNYLLVMFILW